MVDQPGRVNMQKLSRESEAEAKRMVKANAKIALARRIVVLKEQSDCLRKEVLRYSKAYKEEAYKVDSLKHQLRSYEKLVQIALHTVEHTAEGTRCILDEHANAN